MSKAPKEEAPAPEVIPIPPGGAIASINEPPGSDVRGLRFTVTGMTPTTAETGGEIDLHVQGSDFEDGAQIVWGGAPVETEFMSASELGATIDAASATAGDVSVSVTQTGMVFEPALTFTLTDPVGGTRHRHRRKDD